MGRGRGQGYLSLTADPARSWAGHNQGRTTNLKTLAITMKSLMIASVLAVTAVTGAVVTSKPAAAVWCGNTYHIYYYVGRNGKLTYRWIWGYTCR